MQSQILDTHCHLDFNVYNSDRAEVIKRAVESGVFRLVNPGIDCPSSRLILELTDHYPEVYAAVGVHPNDLVNWEASEIEALHKLTKHPKVVAIGEIGLDFYRKNTPVELQITALEKQLQLAAESGLPVILHNRQASQYLLGILEKWVNYLDQIRSPIVQRPGVLHSFSGSLEDAKRAIKMNFFIGISGVITFKNAVSLHHLVSEVPLESLVVETDSPFITPHPRRGQRNEPANVRYVVEKIAEIKGMDFNDVAKITTQNAARLFNWSE